MTAVPATHLPRTDEAARSRSGVMARFLNPFRLASYLLLLYAYGHTVGAVIRIPRFGTESDAVVSMMQRVHVRVQGADATWYGFYRGFGYSIGLYLIFAAFLAWVVGGMTDRSRSALLPVAWALFAVQLVGLPLTFIYFFPAPIVFQAVITVLLAVGCIVQSRRPGGE